MKKTVFMIASLLVLCVALVACGNNGQTEGPSADRIMPTPAGEFPIVPEGTDITITLGVMTTPFIADWNTNYLIRWVEERSGVNIEFIEFPQEQMHERILLALSTNDASNLPDAFLSRNMATGPDTIFLPSFAPRWYNEGMILPLNDMIDEWGYYLNIAFDMAYYEHGFPIKTWMTSADGNIYSFPSFSASRTNMLPHKMWINQGWLDELGLDMPHTTEEFRDVLRAFRDRDPNAIPFTGARLNMSYGYDFIINAFIYNQTNFSRMLVRNDEVIFAPIQDEWRDAMQFLRELHDEGLFDAGAFTQDQNTLRQIATSEDDILGVFEALGRDQVMVTDVYEIMDRFVAMPALTGPNGANYITINSPTATANGIITTAAEHPEVVFRVLDLFMSQEAAMITRYGARGIHWDDAEPGMMTPWGIPALWHVIENVWAQPGQNYNMFQQSPFILDPRVATGIAWDGNPRNSTFINATSVMLLEETGTIPDQLIANLVFTMDELDATAGPRADIDAFVLQAIANFVAGSWDPFDDSDWNNFVSEFDRLGLDEFLDAVQAAFDRQQALN